MTVTLTSVEDVKHLNLELRACSLGVFYGYSGWSAATAKDRTQVAFFHWVDCDGFDNQFFCNSAVGG
ncbi:MAG: hypothetical protein AAGA76_14750 [Pseudomonadota bacterium]